MKIGIVGYRGSGKSTLFEWLTGEAADPALAHTCQTAMAPVVDPRMAALCEIYRPKKSTFAALEMADTPGVSRTHEDSAAKLAMIREAGCLVIVMAAYGGNDALTDLNHFEDDLLIADLDIVAGRVERLREVVRKPRPNREELQKDLQALEPLQAALEAGKHLRDLELTPDQKRLVRAFQLLSEKPRLVVFNVADDEPNPRRFCEQAPAGVETESCSVLLQRELARMEAAEREEFCREMGVTLCDRDQLLRRIMDVSGYHLFFTTSEKEVRAWMLRKGGTALEAAGLIHTDLARGFIRAEAMSCEDLVRLGSEREVKAHNRMRQEHKDYLVQDGEILFIRHS